MRRPARRRPPGRVAIAPSRSSGDARITPLGARITDEHSDLVSHPGTELVVVDLQVEILRRTPVYAHMFRLRADDEWYPNIRAFIDQASAGSIEELSAVFEVPIGAAGLMLEVGGPGTLMSAGAWPDGFGLDDAETPSATWELQFPA
jgi:hypothetical protein